MTEPMNGAQSLVHTLIASGVDTCIANPGTSEMHFVAALDQIPGIRCVLGLQENVVTGMADGYGRMARKPASMLLHCGPGLANGLGNLHNAQKAHTGMVNIVGDQATYHAQYNPPLAAETETLARTISSWTRTACTPDQVGPAAAEAVASARRISGGISTLILPSDASWGPGGVVAPPLPVPAAPAVPPDTIETIARALRAHGPETLILLGNDAVLEPAMMLAWQAAAATGATVMAEFSAPRVPRGQGRPQVNRVPYIIDFAVQALAPFRRIILVNAQAPAGFFAYPGKPSLLHRPDADLITLTTLHQDPVAALAALVAALGAPPAAAPDPGPIPDVASGAPSSVGLARLVAALMPEGGIVVDESMSYGWGFYPHTHAAAAHDWLHLTGGAIGIGPPLATGAALGTQGRQRVLNLQADGSAMYSLQALWTQARERLPVTTVLLSNRRYDILIGEYHNVGATPGPTAMRMLDLGNPALDWVALANGMGVEAARTDTLDGCADLMRRSFRQDGPFLIELAV
jgi:acetolactate synthase-1/2/3 large subunit